MRRLVIIDSAGREFVKTDPIAVPEPRPLGVSLMNIAPVAPVAISEIASLELIDDDAAAPPAEDGAPA